MNVGTNGGSGLTVRGLKWPSETWNETLARAPPPKAEAELETTSYSESIWRIFSITAAMARRMIPRATRSPRRR